MKLLLATVAGQATINETGRMDLRSITHYLKTPALPATVRLITVALQIQLLPLEREGVYQLAVSVQDPDGRIVTDKYFELKSEMDEKRDPDYESAILSPILPAIIEIPNVEFQTPGAHRLEIRCGEDVIGEIPFHIVLATAQPR